MNTLITKKDSKKYKNIYIDTIEKEDGIVNDIHRICDQNTIIQQYIIRDHKYSRLCIDSPNSKEKYV